jgi:CBS domain-containing protein
LVSPHSEQEIAPIEIKDRKGNAVRVEKDEHPRPDTTLEALGRLAGIVTERMLLSFSPGKSSSLDTWELHYLLAKTSVTEAMNPKPHTVTPETDIAEAVREITRGRGPAPRARGSAEEGRSGRGRTPCRRPRRQAHRGGDPALPDGPMALKPATGNG